MNWNKLTYQQKNLVLLAGFFLLLVVAYVFAFSRTKKLLVENDELTAAMEMGENLPLQIASLNKKIQRYDSLVALGQENYQTRLMNALATLGEKRRARLIKAEEVSILADKQYEMFEISFEGKFGSLVRLIDDLEQNISLGSIQSVSFEKKVNRRTKVKSLQVKLYLLRIKSL